MSISSGANHVSRPFSPSLDPSHSLTLSHAIQSSGTDRAPNQHEEDRDLAKMPKNAMRVLLSAQTREDYRKRKREEAEGGASVGNKKGKGKVSLVASLTGRRGVRQGV